MKSKYTIGSLKVEIYFWIVLTSFLGFLSGSTMTVQKMNPELSDKLISTPSFGVVILIGLIASWRLWWVISGKLNLVQTSRTEDFDIKVGVKYTHYKNKNLYTPIDFCKNQIKDRWIDCVIYIDEVGNKYTRDILEFKEKFSLQE